MAGANLFALALIDISSSAESNNEKLEFLGDAALRLAAAEFLMEPEEYYERFGLYIPYTIFPTACPVVDGIIHFYYGVCDTAIALATVPLKDVVDWVMAADEVG